MDLSDDEDDSPVKVIYNKWIIKSSMVEMTDIEKIFFLNEKREEKELHNERLSLDVQLHKNSLDFESKIAEIVKENEYRIISQSHSYEIKRTNRIGVTNTFTRTVDDDLKTRNTMGKHGDLILDIHRMDMLNVEDATQNVYDRAGFDSQTDLLLISVLNSPMVNVNSFISKQFGGITFEGLVVNFIDPYYMVVYHDGDFEELSCLEFTTLSSRKISGPGLKGCLKHAKKLHRAGKISLSEDFNDDV